MNKEREKSILQFLMNICKYIIYYNLYMEYGNYVYVTIC